jgi:hypothetical protein
MWTTTTCITTTTSMGPVTGAALAEYRRKESDNRLSFLLKQMLKEAD